MGRAELRGRSDRELLELIEERTYHLEGKVDKLLAGLNRLAGMVP